MSKYKPRIELFYARWFWKDYLAEESLRFVSLAAEGLWCRMLNLMFPHGELLLNGKPMTPEELAKIRSVTPDETRKCLDELENYGVYSKSKSGVIFCRRMKRDWQQLQCNAANGRKRWAKEKEGGAQAVARGVAPAVAHENAILYYNYYYDSSNKGRGSGGNQKPFPDPPGAAALWAATTERLADEIDPENFATWIAPVAPLGLDAERLFLGLETEFKLSWFMRNYHDRSAGVLGELAGRPVAIEAVILPHWPSLHPDFQDLFRYAEPDEAVPTPDPQDPEWLAARADLNDLLDTLWRKGHEDAVRCVRHHATLLGASAESNTRELYLALADRVAVQTLIEQAGWALGENLIARGNLSLVFLVDHLNN